MSIIQSIRERAAWLVFGLIAVSLIGFLLMDARRSNFFGGDHTTVIGVVDGQKIQADDFNQQVNTIEDRYKKQQQQGTLSDEMQEQIREGVWTRFIQESLLSKYYVALGMDISEKEENDMLAGQNVVPEIRQAFTDRKTGMFDAQAAAAQINQIRSIYKSGPRKGANADNSQYEIAKSFWEDEVPQFVEQRQQQKFLTLLANSAYVPKWMAEKENADNSQIASISYVDVPYYSVPDSAAKVSDAEIMDYVNQHPEEFRQEESRSVAYVTFDASATKEDSAAIRKQLIDLSKDFAATKDPAAFLNRVGSAVDYPDTTVAKSMTHVPFKDSIFALPKGGLYGPYLDAGNYTVAKLIDEHQVPDSVEARHILVATTDPETRQTIMDDTTAKKKIDSIRNLIEKGGQRFDSVAYHLSDDKSSAIKGGKLPWFGPNQMVKDFQDFAFGHKVGDKGVVRSQFGWHYIEVLNQKSFEPGYKVAYLSRKIDPSQNTDMAASGLASQFAGTSRDARSFEDNLQKQHSQRLVAPDIAPSAMTIPGVGSSRQLVRWVYDAELGNVSEPFPVGDKYVVALLTEINKPGVLSAAKARSRVEPILRSRKKAEIISKKLGSPATLDAIASGSQPVLHADTVNFAAGMIPNAGREPRVVGAAFDKGLAGKPASPPIAGNSGVFVIRVEKVSALSNPNSDIQQERFAMEQQQRQLASYSVLQQMQRLANITDNRGKFF